MVQLLKSKVQTFFWEDWFRDAAGFRANFEWSESTCNCWRAADNDRQASIYARKPEFKSEHTWKISSVKSYPEIRVKGRRWPTILPAPLRDGRRSCADEGLGSRLQETEIKSRTERIIATDTMVLSPLWWLWTWTNKDKIHTPRLLLPWDARYQNMNKNVTCLGCFSVVLDERLRIGSCAGAHIRSTASLFLSAPLMTWLLYMHHFSFFWWLARRLTSLLLCFRLTMTGVHFLLLRPRPSAKQTTYDFGCPRSTIVLVCQSSARVSRTLTVSLI